MSYGTPDTRMVCKTCRRVLNKLSRQPEGEPEVHVGWSHTYVSDHDPNPVPIAEFTSVHEVCDFCGTDDPDWLLPTDDFTIRLPGQNNWGRDQSGAWLACATCKDLAENDPRGLTARSIATSPTFNRTLPAEVRGALEQHIRRLHKSFFRARNAPPQPYVSLKDQT